MAWISVEHIAHSSGQSTYINKLACLEWDHPVHADYQIPLIIIANNSINMY